MDRYKVLNQLGDGTYGCVWEAQNTHTHERVAIKRMKRKFYSWQECVSLREVKSLRKLTHPSIVKLKEVIWDKNILFLSFEYMDCNLYEMLKERNGKPFSDSQVRKWTAQILQGLDYMHRHGYFHRDLKPENLLVHGLEIIKIADFGLAREVRSQPPYTEYVSTRWYRAPEVLLRKADYSAPVDLFAVGAIMAELFSLKPLFPGSSEIDQIYKICNVMGTFSAATWPEGQQLAEKLGFRLQHFPPQPMSKFVRNASPEALDLISLLCQWDPSRRPTAAQALQHPFFQGAAAVPRTPGQPVLQERTNTSPGAVPVPTFQLPPFVVSGGGLAPSAKEAAFMWKGLSVVGVNGRGVDWTPLQSSMQASGFVAAGFATGKPAAVPAWPAQAGARAGTQQAQQQPERHTHRQPGQPPPDLWVDAKRPAVAGRSNAALERGAGVKPGAWSARGHPSGPIPKAPPAGQLPSSLSPGVPLQNVSLSSVLIPAHRSRPAAKTLVSSSTMDWRQAAPSPDRATDPLRSSVPDALLAKPPLLENARVARGGYGPMSASPIFLGTVKRPR